MHPLETLFANNEAWAKGKLAQDPQFFSSLAAQQRPGYLWIGCADSRVPANELLGLPPGEVFVHRNVANVVIHTDFNCLSTIQFAIDVLQVRHIMVVGHYGCGGVRAALDQTRVGITDNWLRHIRDIADRHETRLQAIDDYHERYDRLCDLNVIEQVTHVCQTTIVEDAWQRGQAVSVHGWVYGLKDGLLRDLKVTVSSQNDLNSVRDQAIEATFSAANQNRQQTIPVR